MNWSVAIGVAVVVVVLGSVAAILWWRLANKQALETMGEVVASQGVLRYTASDRFGCDGRARFLLRVKWPLLRPALWSAFAVGFAVSVAQYLPTLFIGAGRYATVTTEAVTLASGAQRSLTSAYAWLQWLLPVLMFSLAAWVARPRRFSR